MSDDQPQHTKLSERLLRSGLLQRGAAELSQPEPTAAPGPPLETLIDGEWVENAYGRCFVSETPYDLSFVHGNTPLSELLRIPDDTWAPFIWPPDLSINPTRALFIDTETTGLARSTGTYAFMAGVGLFEGKQFIVRQYFMPDYGDEEALLDLLDHDLAATTGLVSFNGRTFDWPIITTRYVLARRPLETPEPPHLDLLSLSRRLWRRTLPSCSLGSLERQILGIERSSEDVPGYEIPRIYQDYVRYGYTSRLASVFYHNVIDVVSMVALAAQMGRLILSDGAPLDDVQCDALSLGLVYERTEQPERALEAYRLAAQDARYPNQAQEANERQGRLLKRLGRIDQAVDLWHNNLDGRSIYPYIELAKHYEHREKDYAAAMRVTTAALELVQNGVGTLPSMLLARYEPELLHRLARLEKRLARAHDRETN